MGTERERTVGVRALKQNASAMLRRVAESSVATITDRERPVARLSPIAGQGASIDVLIAEGLARGPVSADPHSFAAVPRRSAEISAREIPDDTRGHR